MSAVDNLRGLELADGWKVTEHLARNPNGTGGHFSQSYLAKKGKKIGFVKAFDFAEAWHPGVNTPQRIESLVAAYNHEKALLDHCNTRRLSNVVLAISHGQVEVPGMNQMEGTVFYLIFEMAECDARVQMDISTKCDALWCLRALKDISLGLWQVHREMIAHQDTKPSNVLLFSDGGFKVADFGRASRRGYTAPHDGLSIAGDRTYAPPELLYGFVNDDFIPRRMGCDLYMLGNLAAFLFSGVNVSANLFLNLDSQHHPTNWKGNFKQVVPYLEHAFSLVLNNLKPLIDHQIRDEVLPIIRQLCQPDPSRRGHPRGLATYNQYSLERYVSQLDLIYRRLAIRKRSERTAA